MGNSYKPPSGNPANRLQRMLDFCRQVLTTAGPALKLPDERLHQEDDPELNRLEQRFSNELFARLLLELPVHREAMETAYKAGDYRRLRHTVHQLLGATAYCDAPELDSGLRELRLALQTGEHNSIELRFTRAINLIDSTLRDCGYRSGE